MAVRFPARPFQDRNCRNPVRQLIIPSVRGSHSDNEGQ
jgi:hypothetical protein